MLKSFIDALVGSGLSEIQIAELVETTQPTINRLRNGKQKAGYELGKKIERLHAQRCSAVPPPPTEERAA